MGDLVFATPWDRGDPCHKTRQRSVGGGGGWRLRLGRSFRDPRWGSYPWVFGNRGRDSKGDVGCLSRGRRACNSLPEHTSQGFKVKRLG